MKSDLVQLMREHAIDGLFITGAGHDNPAMVYMTGGMEVNHADLFLQPGKPGVLFHSDIERDGAARCGYPLRSLANFHYGRLLQEAGGNRMLATAYRYRDQFASAGLTSGRVVVYGQMDVGQGHYLLSKLEEFFPDLQFVMEPASDVLRIARAVKDEQEITRIKRMGEVTVEVAAGMADFLTLHAVRNQQLVKKDGEPLTIGDVKTWLRLKLLEKGVQEQGTILSIGRDAGVPHNEGNQVSPIRLGETIIFDAFFQEAGGGYFYDFTRTWCLGHASDEIQRDHEAVRSVHQKIAGAIKAGISFYDYQKMACELFQQQGYPTILENPATQEGYVHGVGHGIGLEVHELPAANADIPENILQPGMVITVEPGLYFPGKGYGMRVEDSYQILEDGSARRLAEYPWDLVLPVHEK